MKTNQYNIHHGFLDDYCGNTGLRKLLAVFKALLLNPVDNDKVKLDNGNRVRGRKFCSTVQKYNVNNLKNLSFCSSVFGLGR